MNWKYLAALIALYLCGVISGVDLGFKIDQHLAIMQATRLTDEATK